MAYPQVGEPTKLAADNKGGTCSACEEARHNADFEASQRCLGKYPRLENLKGGPEKKRLVALRRGLVAQMLGKPGAFRERIEEVRGYWQIDDPPTQLPPVSEDFLLPPSIEEGAQDLSSLLAAAANHPRLSPPVARLPRPDSLSSVRRNLIACWQRDLCLILSASEELERYLEDHRAPYYVHTLGGSAIPQEHLPWYRFASACVVGGVPLEEAPDFADYGELPARPVLRTWSGRELRERGMERLIWDEQEKFIIEKILEKHSLDYYSEMLDVYERFGTELEEEIPKRIREEFELDMEYSPPRHYHIKFIPGKHRDLDLTNTRAGIEKQAGIDARPGPKAETPKDALLPVWCAVLKAHGWPEDRIAASLHWRIGTVQKEIAEGRKLLDHSD